MKHGTVVDLGLGHIVIDGHPALPPFLAHVRCGQTAGWIMMPLGMEVGLGPGHIVLDGDPAPTPKGHSRPIFGLAPEKGGTVHSTPNFGPCLL